MTVGCLVNLIENEIGNIKLNKYKAPMLLSIFYKEEYSFL